MAASGDPELDLLLTRFYRHVTADDVRDMGADERLAAVASMREFAAVRSPGQALVRIDHQPGSRATIARVVTDDMPFLVDSITAALVDAGRSIQLVMHPQLVVQRDAAGGITSIVDQDVDEARPEGAIAESWMYFRMERTYVRETYTDLEQRLVRILADVRAAVSNWQSMRDRALAIARDLETATPVGVASFEVDEAIALLEWLADDNFTFLGYRDYELTSLDGVDTLVSLPKTGLGILRPRNSDEQPTFTPLPAHVAEHARDSHLLVMSKANSYSTVHRHTYLDYISIKTFDATGVVTGERRFLGLYTAAAYHASVTEIPIVRERVQRVMDTLDLVPGSHSARDLREFFESYPRDELFQAHTHQLVEVASSLMHLRERRQTRLHVRPDDYGRFVSCLVYLPRDRYTTDVRLRLAELLREAFGGVSTEYRALVTESVLARLHYLVRLPDDVAIPDVDLTALEARIAAVTQGWDDAFRDAIVTGVGEERASDLLETYAGSFAAGYQAEWTPSHAIEHVLMLEALPADGIDVRWLNDPVEGARLTVFGTGASLTLSRVLPMLQHLGLEVLAEHPYEIPRPGQTDAWILDFSLQPPPPNTPELDSLADRIADAFRAAWSGECESDAFNSIVLLGGLTWQQAAVVRAYAQYLRQLGTAFSLDYIQAALLANMPVVMLLRELFIARFDPAFSGDRSSAELDARIASALDAVVSLDHDRILRGLLAIMNATVRTNAFTLTDPAKSALAFKLEPRRIPDAPLPRPRFEIWVSSPRVQGVHLRFGSVARGGLRWSDRREDFRTEVLGLVKAQEVKNAIIVPVGAKGGFVPSTLPDPVLDRDAWMNAGKAAYREFVGALLDLTDNLVDGLAVPPAGMVRHDGDDPYLVVAADKGTATFSDLANAISLKRGFWLGDAFASGGSAGYDHKAMGITARGAWESVKRHFRELGIDTQAEDFTVVGIGDMSGDVFGNGMLLSPHIRLVAAFDHRHVFIDPTPDAVDSLAERARLFAQSRSSWADYDADLISPGGGVYPRSAKSIELSDQARTALGISEPGARTPDEVIHAILTAPVDLLWNGGIGTYVKATAQANADVGDKANDAIRVNGRQLRCRVIGEGGNLGMTQLGRIEAARAGIRLNTDAIDNSAGVDTSDHEVNIKILIDPLVRSGALSEQARLDLLAEMTDDVASLVLEDNIEQNITLGNERAIAPSMLRAQQSMMQDLEHDGSLDRALEFLPDDVEIDARADAGLGLTSPELAVLLAYAKNHFTGQLLAGDLSADAWFDTLVDHYFPARLSERPDVRVNEHPLRSEIIATVACNRIINIGGITFVVRAMSETGASAVDVAKAATVALEVFELPQLWRRIGELANTVPTTIQDSMYLMVQRLLDRATRWILQTRGGAISVADQIEQLRPTVRRWLPQVPMLMQGEALESCERAAAVYAAAGVPSDLALSVAALLDAYVLLDITEIAARSRDDAGALVPLYFAVSAHFDVEHTLVHISALPRNDRWSAQARHALRSDLYAVVAQLTARIASATDQRLEPAARIQAWESHHAAGLARARATIAEINDLDHSDLATLSVVLRVMRNLVAQTSANGN